MVQDSPSQWRSPCRRGQLSASPRIPPWPSRRCPAVPGGHCKRPHPRYSPRNRRECG
ncbi:hypothetical protein C8Q80DRAFT_1201377 [Daedaleopsis nitida]|nr:hypothetical protein C8Q80DRAFT_1201377 [Daedaleopsis nitida]